ncbi:hypothetical protein D8674_024948 [Pyrus ussuriensis x Pyrus communis]|uniref:Lon N-terminal domain-containing protein n=1 Tax=Pyrus ussuriensis x Pyrus communis TaxID=2448454 RepID=A0A5N5H4C0_9ROSA|nr:hypothetical protein D8674_024948 [Pyrus ussuriensis x Pyrus communis]
MKKLKRCRHLAPQNATSLVELELPLLPFPLNEVLNPSESKALHLYEARYLALLEESLTWKKLFVNFVLDPVIIDNSSGEASFAARNGCLVFIENVERLEVGALVSIRGIGRVKVVKFVQWIIKSILENDLFYPTRERQLESELVTLKGSNVPASTFLQLETARQEIVDLKTSLDAIQVKYESAEKEIGCYIPHIQDLEHAVSELRSATYAKDEELIAAYNQVIHFKKVVDRLEPQVLELQGALKINESLMKEVDEL